MVSQYMYILKWTCSRLSLATRMTSEWKLAVNTFVFILQIHLLIISHLDLRSVILNAVIQTLSSFAIVVLICRSNNKNFYIFLGIIKWFVCIPWRSNEYQSWWCVYGTFISIKVQPVSSGQTTRIFWNNGAWCFKEKIVKSRSNQIIWAKTNLYSSHLNRIFLTRKLLIFLPLKSSGQKEYVRWLK